MSINIRGGRALLDDLPMLRRPHNGLDVWAGVVGRDSIATKYGGLDKGVSSKNPNNESKRVLHQGSPLQYMRKHVRVLEL